MKDVKGRGEGCGGEGRRMGRGGVKDGEGRGKDVEGRGEGCGGEGRRMWRGVKDEDGST